MAIIATLEEIGISNNKWRHGGRRGSSISALDGPFTYLFYQALKNSILAKCRRHSVEFCHVAQKSRVYSNVSFLYSDLLILVTNGREQWNGFCEASWATVMPPRCIKETAIFTRLLQKCQREADTDVMTYSWNSSPVSFVAFFKGRGEARHIMMMMHDTWHWYWFLFEKIR